MNPLKTVMRKVGKELECADFLGRGSFNKELISNSEKIKFKWRKPGRMKI